MKISKDKLKIDLLTAFFKAKQHKGQKTYIKCFENNLSENIDKLCEDIYNRNYIAEPSTCFIIDHPKKREVFAAKFRDRIVHHLYYEYTHEIFERTFISDSYSCIKNRGTHYGIDRLEHHIKACSNNHQELCYCLKMDIKGYFINMNKNILLDIVKQTLNKYENKFSNVLDFELLYYLSEQIIKLDPTLNCEFKCTKENYIGLPKSKTLFYSPKNCGLPIGNLTSQLFSNVYLNVLDQYVKRELKCKHYGRYVDDFYIIDKDKEKLKLFIDNIRCFLKEKLKLDLQEGKTKITTNFQGVEFLGAYLKPFRRYISNQSLRRMKQKLNSHDKKNITHEVNSNISYIGILSHYKTFNIKKQLFIT